MRYSRRSVISTLIMVVSLLSACISDMPRPEILATELASATATPGRETATGTKNTLNSATIVGRPDGNPDFPDFPHGEFNPLIPHDVDNLFLNQNADLRVRQRLFDILSWQTFLALNWPVNEGGSPHPTFTDPGAPTWTTWKTSTTLMREAGLDPGLWNSPQPGPATPCPAARRQLANLDVTSTDRIDLLDTVTQADANKLWDQNGNLVYYEILLNQPEYDYIRAEDLYSLDGQAAFYQNQETLYFPTGKFWDNSGQKQSTDPALAGVIELKLAWKIIDAEHDLASRFYTEPACLRNEQGRWEQKVVGLVGMHIAHRTFSAAQWVWATFEQVDNTEVDPQEVQAYAQQGQRLTPSFFDPTCQECQPNTVSVQNGITRTQVVPIVESQATVQALNQQVQQQLKEAGSVWQYYRLIGTQWPPDSNSAGAPQPIPAALTNPVLETYVPPVEASCMNCHYRAAIAVQITGQRNGSAEVNWGPPGSADFSFLLMKAYLQTLVCGLDSRAATPVIAELPTTYSSSIIAPDTPLRKALQGCQVALSQEATVAKNLARSNTWQISDGQQGYVIRLGNGTLSVYRNQ